MGGNRRGLRGCGVRFESVYVAARKGVNRGGSSAGRKSTADLRSQEDTGLVCLPVEVGRGVGTWQDNVMSQPPRGNNNRGGWLHGTMIVDTAG